MGVSRKIWSGVKFGPPGPKYAITAGPPPSQTVPALLLWTGANFEQHCSADDANVENP